MEDFKILFDELKKRPVLYVLIVIAASIWSLVFYSRLIVILNSIARDIGAALAI